MNNVTELQTVPALAAGASTTVAHTLRNGQGSALTPNWIFPTDTGALAVPTAYDSSGVTYTNQSAQASPALTFRVAYEHTIVRASSTAKAQFIYSGPAGGLGGGPFVGFSNDSTYNQQVYVDGTNGLDTNPGTLLLPLRTKRAVDLKFPQKLSGDAKLLIHMAGVGGFGTSATAPLSYEEPTVLVGGPGSSAHNGYCIRAAQRVAANPTTGPATAALDVVPAVEIDQANVAAPGTGLRTRLDFTVAAPAWTANNFRNSKFYVRISRAGVLVIPETPIVENTADTLTIDVLCVAQLLNTDTVEIVRPSVEFTGPAADFNFFKIVGQGTAGPLDTRGLGAAGNGNTIEGVAFVGSPTFENFVGGLDTCSASGSAILFWGCQVTLLQCKFQCSTQMYSSAFNLSPGSPRFTSGVNPINQSVSFRTTLCAVGTMTIGDLRGGPSSFAYDDVLSHYGGSSLRVWGPGSALSSIGSASAILLGSGATGSGLWARAGAKIYVQGGTRTQITGATGALRVGTLVTIVAYGTGAGQFEEAIGYNGNLYAMDGSVPATPTGDESQITNTA